VGDRAVIERIGAWEASGLIDAPLAARLRSAEMGLPTDGPAGAAVHPRQGVVAAIFGPPVTIAEMFAYLGAIFLLAAWYAAISRIAGPSVDPQVLYLIGAAIAATALAILGIRLTSGSPRQRRAAGALLLVAAASVGWAAWSAGQLVLPPGAPAIQVVATAAALVAALAFRRVHPSVLTQVGLLLAVVTLSGAVLDALNRVLFPLGEFDAAPVAGADPLLRVLMGAAWWAVTAAVIGVIALSEAGAALPAADRRAALSRFAAGLTAVVGISASVFASGPRVNGDYGRILEPAVGDLILVVVAAILIERAFRREAAAFIYPAGLAVIIALSDLNSSYLAPASSADVGLFVEGAILLAAGVVFDRLRRRVNGTGVASASETAAVVATDESGADPTSAPG
jgi:hypothetical protein